MPTKRYLQDRVEQLKRELEAIIRERDAARGEPRDIASKEPSSLTQGEAMSLAEGVRAGRQELLDQLKETTARLRSAEDRLRAKEEESMTEVEDLKARLETAEAENRRWLERERRWTQLEERLQQEASKMANELSALRTATREGEGGRGSVGDGTATTVEDVDPIPTTGSKSTGKTASTSATEEEATPTQSVPMATEGWKERLRPRGQQTRKSSNEDVSSGERGRCNSMT